MSLNSDNVIISDDLKFRYLFQKVYPSELIPLTESQLMCVSDIAAGFCTLEKLKNKGLDAEEEFIKDMGLKWNTCKRRF